MITGKNILFRFVTKRNIRKLINKVYLCIKENKIYSTTFDNEEDKNFNKISISVIDKNKIQVTLDHIKQISRKKIVDVKVVSDVYEFFKEFFVYIYIDKEPINCYESNRMYITLSLNVDNINFSNEVIESNISYVCDNDLKKISIKKRRKNI